MEQVEENFKRLDSKSYFKRDVQAGSPSVDDMSEGPDGSEYIAAPRSLDDTPAPDSPEYNPAPHSPVFRNTCDPERPKTHVKDPSKDECSFHENIQSPSCLPSVSNIFLGPPEGTRGDSEAISGDEDGDILLPEVSNNDDFKSLTKENNVSQAIETKSDVSSFGSSPLLVQTIEELEI